MAVTTMGAAWALGWKATARCLGKLRDKPKDTRDCTFTCDLDMNTLVMSKGPNFPLEMLQVRMICPRCGGRDIAIMYQPPSGRPEAIRLRSGPRA